jgi:hypothetical protein
MNRRSVSMTSEELGFGGGHVTFGTIAKLVSVTCLVCVVFVGAMYFIGKGNTQSIAPDQVNALTTQTK